MTGKKNLIIIIILLLIIGAEITATVMIRTTPYPEVFGLVADKTDKKPDTTHKVQAIEEGILNEEVPIKDAGYYHLTKFSVDGRNYESAVVCLEKEEARIISLKTKEDTLVIPSQIGGYPVTCVGGSWAELEEAVQSVRSTLQTPELGKIAWMTDPDKPYKKIEIQEGICAVFHESFYGVKTDELILPASMKLLGALSFANSEIEEIRWKETAPVAYWGAFLNTKNRGVFSLVSGDNRDYYIRSVDFSQ